MTFHRFNISSHGLLIAIIVSGLAIPAYDLMPLKRLQLIPGGNIVLFADNSGTTSKKWIDQKASSFQCTFVNKPASSRYCGLDVTLGDESGNGIDLSAYNSIHLKMTYSGESNVVRLYVRHAMKDTPTKTEHTIYKYNNVILPAKDIQKEMEIKITQLFVAEWWLRTARLPWKYSSPDVSNATNIGIDTPTPTTFGDHHFTVQKLTLAGNYISRENWYLCIMFSWCIYFIVQAFLRFRALRQQAAISRIEMINALQQSEQFKQESLRYKEQSLIDPLTNIYNRRGITYACENQLNISGLPSCAVMVDIDHFKVINDNHGHEVGDRIIFKMAETLQKGTRNTDLVARWGGEEFLILCSNTTPVQAFHLTEHLRQDVSKHCNIPGGQSVTASFGIAEIIGGDIESAIQNADAALYEAKKHGRNCSRIHTK